MIRSMTGFGEAVRMVPDGELRATVKTVNHRNFNPHLRTPPGFDRFEADLQSRLNAHFSRGHVNLSLVLDRRSSSSGEGFPVLDLERARHFRDLFRELAEELGLPEEPGLALLLRFGDILRPPEDFQEQRDLDPEVVMQVVDEAAKEARARREEEGARLEQDLRDRLSAMETELKQIETRAPARLLSERDRLRSAIQELTEQEEVDEDRMAREVAYMADRWDINEELVRARAHIQAFRDTLNAEAAGVVGKRLGFLVQEMHREANTIASKANDLEIAHHSVSLREEIERLREQLENVE